MRTGAARCQPSFGLAPASVPLAPAAINVLPTPKLHVHYFHERDVFSDDPFTDPIEPAKNLKSMTAIIAR